MISNQVLQNTLDGLRSITRTDLCITDTEGKVLASTFSETVCTEDEVLAFAQSQADSQVIKGYQYFKVHDDHQLEYILVINSAGEDVYTLGKLVVFQIQSLLTAYEIDAKIVIRKKHYVVYVKEGSQIVELLGLMGAHISLMQLENVRIVKEMRNSVNRRVNCETANITKTVTAATRQIEDIIYIRDHYGLENLPEPLSQMAEVRLENPDAPLKELGEYLDPPVGKSGVNHRLRKLSELADRIRT